MRKVAGDKSKEEVVQRKAEKLSRKVEKLRDKRNEYDERLRQTEAELSNVCKRKAGDQNVWDDLPKKRAKYVDNRFLAEKSSYDRRLLEVNNPFVDIKSAPEPRYMPPDNVSDGKLMDEAALTAAVQILLKPVATTCRQFKARTELGARIVHASILQNMKLLTRPSSEGGNERLADSQVVAGGREQLQLKDLQYVDQESDDEGDEGIGRLGKVHDMQLHPANNLVTVIVIECDWKDAMTKLDQGAGYAIRAAKLNMKKGRYEPIYIHHWCKAGWRYGVLRPRGIVTVKDGTVVDIVHQTGIQDKDKASLDDLKSKLKDFTEILSEQFPDDEYVLGSLDFCAKEMSLPTSPDELINEGGLLFFNSLIRTFLGDRALTLTSADIEHNRAKREAAIDEDIVYCMSSISTTYGRLARGVKQRSQSASQSVLSSS
ncbi:hypothetical protein SELMODRAFT_402783 [Selaginella moellendorffii]|uniref:Uncharacterized protein n=1 Tax=Selaginella moellendorffii TaxID=88036 RepID=D8QN14_SELML|nr:hypothetical protein SELMODRAFT_402783 [Selaginella moellendorffii]